MTRAEVIEYLGKSKRTVAEYAAKGKLPTHYVSGPNGREVRFDRADVERLKVEIDTPIERTVEKPTDLARTNTGLIHPVPSAEEAAQSLAPIAEGFVAALRTSLHGPPAPATVVPHMTLAETVKYSGLPAAFLVAAARAGTIRAVNVGKGKREFWRFAKEAPAK